ncbi:phage terminase small subunit P27 family [Mycobacterium marinum]|uniref:phage terminase small subunit P27 family n=1 Tax=Mycobacterium marinum TaxID=1781 RepID=UPI003568F98E
MGGVGSGRIAEPAGLKLLKGRGPGRDSGGRKLPTAPKFERGAPEPPDYLTSDVALAEWRNVVPQLERLDLLSPAHQAAIACYCMAVADNAAATAIVAAEGRIIVNPKTGHRHPNPAVADARASRAQILRFAREFGLTASAEQRFGAADDSDDNDDPFAG